MGREPSLSVFFWFFSLRQAEKDWEEEFVEELSRLSTLSCSTLTTNKGYFAKDLIALKKRASCSLVAAAVGAIAEATPLAAARSEPSRPTKEIVLSPPIIALDSSNGSLGCANIDAGDSTAKHLGEEGALESQERPLKRMVTTGTKAGDVGDFVLGGFIGASGMTAYDDNGWGRSWPANI
ncbi:hypothetical protein CR513_48819, partial [Mucuna pruriens]